MQRIASIFSKKYSLFGLVSFYRHRVNCLVTVEKIKLHLTGSFSSSEKPAGVNTAGHTVSTTATCQRSNNIEKLNLSLLGPQASDLGSAKTLTPRSVQSDAVPTKWGLSYTGSVAGSDVSMEAPEGHSEIPFQNLQSLQQLDMGIMTNEHNVIHGRQVSRQTGGREQPVVVNSTKLALMTPADFLNKRADQKVMKEDRVTPRSVTSEVSLPPSCCQSSVTTPRIVCDDANHHHPMLETRSFKPSDLEGGTIPQSAAGSVTPMDQLSTLGFDEQFTERTVTPRSQFESLSSRNQLPAFGSEQITSALTKHQIRREIIVIRNRLKSFDQKKKKLR